MGTIYAVTAQKGGNAKTTTAHNMAAAFSLKGLKTLIIDTDPQAANLSMITGADKKAASVSDLLEGTSKAGEVIQPLGDKLDIIPANSTLTPTAEGIGGKGKARRLIEAIQPIKDNYDRIIIDTPPALGILSINALTAADRLIIPCQADIFSIVALKELSESIEVTRQRANEGLTIAGILLTRYQPRSILTQELTDSLTQAAEKLQTKIFSSRIREAIAIKESQTLHTDIFRYAPKSKVAADYKAFIKELESRK